MTSIKMCWYYYMVFDSNFCNYCNILWLIVRVASGFCRLNGSSSLFLSLSWYGSRIIFLKFWSGKIWIPMKNVIRKIWFHEFQRECSTRKKSQNWQKDKRQNLWWRKKSQNIFYPLVRESHFFLRESQFWVITGVLSLGKLE